MASLMDVALSAVAEMTEEQRVEFISQFRGYWCIGCGGLQPEGRSCQCDNDE